uniref:Peptidase A1 domain-containing protein n=1 Tax=Kalanchoe fedtschenkoi TaxID=63787 RepID=A0A7N0TUM4_KALFE
MDHSLTPLLLLILVYLCDGRIFSFEMHHRYSDRVRKWSHETGRASPGDWPLKGSVDYYAALLQHDRALRGRSTLSDSDGPLSFADGNSTIRLTSLGFLHYASVKLGTPGMKFLVALDTGSDLFWVPCECSRCAPTDGTTYASDFELSIYNPKISSTSKKVDCNHSLCYRHNKCLETSNECPYMVSYVSAETSTTGVLVQDLLHLTTEGSHREVLKAYVTFGCGRVQTGSFLDGAAPNGLFGLGMDKISVPSILSSEGLIRNSFSMCFGQDGIGRISFGDLGSNDQQETPFSVNSFHPNYTVISTGLRVGMSVIDTDFTALFDSGTSFTYLMDPIYTMLSKSFHSQVREKRRPADSRIPFEYCYYMSPESNASLIPSVTLTMKGDGQFFVYEPVLVISTQNELLYCLAVVKSTELNIIGQNFMTGYRVVFNREKLTLGWKKFDCYDIEEADKYPPRPNATHVPPAVAAGVGNVSSHGGGHKEYMSSFAKPSQLSQAVSAYLIILQILAFNSRL